MHAIELETVIPADGKLPDAFHEAFGRKAHVIVLLPEKDGGGKPYEDDSQRLMGFAGSIAWPIEDPVEWQRCQRNEWERQWER